MIKGFTAGKSARFISGFTGAVFLPFTGLDFFSMRISLYELIIPARSAHRSCYVSKRAVATAAAARLAFEMLPSGRVACLGALLIMKNGPYLPSRALTINGFVASIFFDFFKVFLAILFPPRLICPIGHLLMYMQSNRQTPAPLRQSASYSIRGTSRRTQAPAIPRQTSRALN